MTHLKPPPAPPIPSAAPQLPLLDLRPRQHPLRRHGHADPRLPLPRAALHRLRRQARRQRPPALQRGPGQGGGQRRQPQPLHLRDPRRPPARLPQPRPDRAERHAAILRVIEPISGEVTLDHYEPSATPTERSSPTTPGSCASYDPALAAVHVAPPPAFVLQATATCLTEQTRLQETGKGLLHKPRPVSSWVARAVAFGVGPGFSPGIPEMRRPGALAPEVSSSSRLAIPCLITSKSKLHLSPTRRLPSRPAHFGASPSEPDDPSRFLHRLAPALGLAALLAAPSAFAAQQPAPNNVDAVLHKLDDASTRLQVRSPPTSASTSSSASSKTPPPSAASSTTSARATPSRWTSSTAEISGNDCPTTPRSSATTRIINYRNGTLQMFTPSQPAHHAQRRQQQGHVRELPHPRLRRQRSRPRQGLDHHRPGHRDDQRRHQSHRQAQAGRQRPRHPQEHHLRPHLDRSHPRHLAQAAVRHPCRRHQDHLLHQHPLQPEDRQGRDRHFAIKTNKETQIDRH